MHGYVIGPRHKWVEKRDLNHFQRCAALDLVIKNLQSNSRDMYIEFKQVMQREFDINTIYEHPEDYFPFLNKTTYGLWYVFAGYGALRTKNSTNDHFDYGDAEGRKRMIEYLTYFRGWTIEHEELPVKFTPPQELCDCAEKYLETLGIKREHLHTDVNGNVILP